MHRHLLAGAVRLFLILAVLAPLVAVGTQHAHASVSEEILFLQLINSHRKELGLPVLKLSPKMTRAAKWLSTDMGANKYFSHTDSKGRDPFDRMDAYGYTYNTWRAENIAAGHTTADKVFAAWLKSEPHRKNIENGNYTAIGIGRVYVSGSPYGWYWTTDFGGVADSATSEAMANYKSVSSGVFQYSEGSKVNVRGAVVGNHYGSNVTVQVQKYVYDKSLSKWVWKAQTSRSLSLSTASGYATYFTPTKGSYRVRTAFAGGGYSKSSLSPYRYFKVN